MRPPRLLLALLTGALLGLAALASPPATPAAAEATPRPDFSGYQSLLARYVVPLGGKGDPYDTRFDYEQLYVDERIWTLKRSDRLDRVRAQLLATPPSRFSERDQRAWRINMYNFLVLERATLDLLVPNRQFLRVKSVDEIHSGAFPFFDRPVLDLEGESYSISRFEREVIYGDTGPAYEPRTTVSDPRLMFALVSGIAGDPPILPWAFHGDSLDAQLDRATRIATALPRIVRVDPKANRFELTNLFFDHRMDFGGLEHVREWLERHADREVRRAIGRLPQGFAPTYFEVDRSLNQFERRKTPIAPADSLQRGS